MDQKEQANQYFKEGNYDNAIKIYTQMLESDENNHVLLSNRSIAYIKIEQFNNALVDAIKCTKLKPDWSKAWGRVGAALYSLDKFDEALVAYNKANELEPSENYQEMINEIKKLLTDLKNQILNESMIKNETMIKNMTNNIPANMTDNIMENIKEFMPEINTNSVNDSVNDSMNNSMNNPNMENLFSSMFDSVISNPTLLEKLSNPEFQSKILSLQNNPLEALQDKDVMKIMGEMMKNFKM